MKRWIWLTLGAIVVIGAGMTLVALPSEQEWTTESPEALAIFEEGVDANYKLYHEDAYRLFVRATELDPDFVMAKLWSVRGKMMYGDKEKAEGLFEEVLAADTSNLTPREKFFIEFNRARHEERRQDLPKIIDDYLERHPTDPYVLNEKAQRAFSLGEWTEAKRLYERLVEIAPNWVIAYNQLGYINMSEGRFAQAEESFKSYRFIAPDQANPYDSLGELFIAIGRYDEAEQSFEQAIEIKPDFWATYEHIALLKSFAGDLEGTRAIIDRARTAGMPEEYVAALQCHEQFMGLRNSASWQQIVERADDSNCITKDKSTRRKQPFISRPANSVTGSWRCRSNRRRKIFWPLLSSEAPEGGASIHWRPPSRTSRAFVSRCRATTAKPRRCCAPPMRV